MDILGGFINISGGFLHAIIRLSYFTGKMIRDFIGGKRADYFRPFQLFFVLTAIANIASRRYGILLLRESANPRCKYDFYMLTWQK
jgi:hypothetical protein